MFTGNHAVFLNISGLSGLQIAGTMPLIARGLVFYDPNTHKLVLWVHRCACSATSNAWPSALGHSCARSQLVFLFLSLVQLLGQVILEPHLADCVQLSFQIVDVVLFVFQDFLE